MFRSAMQSTSAAGVFQELEKAVKKSGATAKTSTLEPPEKEKETSIILSDRANEEEHSSLLIFSPKRAPVARRMPKRLLAKPRKSPSSEQIK